MLDKEAVAVARVGLVAIIGVGAENHVGRVGGVTAGAAQHLEVAKRNLPLGKLANRAIQAAVGLGGKEGLLAVVKLLVFAARAVGRVAVGHVVDVAAVLEVGNLVHPGRHKHVVVHICLKTLAGGALHQLIHELERGVDVLVASAARLEVQVVEVDHVAHRLHVGGGEFKVTVGAVASVGHSRGVAQQLAQRDALPKVGLEFREPLVHGVVEAQQAALGKLQHGHGAELLRHRCQAEPCVHGHALAGVVVCHAVALLKQRLAMVEHQHGGAGVVRVVVNRAVQCVERLLQRRQRLPKGS